ncbi:hypothetical protein K7X08_007095 [Anisodus acutangulus]|uniref:Uncharacterized protein n=1 Tax=Anisodus acutangulus TaxID=402998 RepID=A0A9Q1LCI0_9SOLA|nr:hypothetical protein K7X08_007095 [Anisodus acutangulus]
MGGATGELYMYIENNNNEKGQKEDVDDSVTNRRQEGKGESVPNSKEAVKKANQQKEKTKEKSDQESDIRANSDMQKVDDNPVQKDPNNKKKEERNKETFSYSKEGNFTVISSTHQPDVMAQKKIENKLSMANAM